MPYRGPMTFSLICAGCCHGVVTYSDTAAQAQEMQMQTVLVLRWRCFNFSPSLTLETVIFIYLFIYFPRPICSALDVITLIFRGKCEIKMRHGDGRICIGLLLGSFHGLVRPECKKYNRGFLLLITSSSS